MKRVATARFADVSSTSCIALPLRLADDDPNDATDVDGGDGAQEDGALLLGCQAVQVSEEHAILKTALISNVRTRVLFSCGITMRDTSRGQARIFCWPSFCALHNLFSTSLF